uniref:U1-type domain-containing protein n=1 Tax=Sparus aurata TaxID=8175 RepID=A0A671VAV9_SPAAU
MITASTANKSHLPTKISAKDRAKDYPGVLDDSGGKLFCTPCNCVLDHRRKSTLDDHFATAKHSRMVKAAGEEAKKQLTNTEASTSKMVICETWVATCTAINIPLSKSDHPALRKFLNEKVMNGGAIPGFHQLQEMYLGAVYEREKEELKTLLAENLLL